MNREKLHVNTKKPTHSSVDMSYSVVNFIDLNEHLLNRPEEERLESYPNIGVIVVSPERKKKYEGNLEALFKLSTLQCYVQFPENKKL